MSDLVLSSAVFGVYVLFYYCVLLLRVQRRMTRIDRSCSFASTFWALGMSRALVLRALKAAALSLSVFLGIQIVSTEEIERSTP